MKKMIAMGFLLLMGIVNLAVGDSQSATSYLAAFWVLWGMERAS